MNHDCLTNPIKRRRGLLLFARKSGIKVVEERGDESGTQTDESVVDCFTAVVLLEACL